jgi:predicted naringenin-chalcone synthase
MIRPGIQAIHTAVPDICVTQEEISSRYAEFFGETKRRQRAIQTIFDRTGVQQRYMPVPPTWFYENRTTKGRNDTYMEHAVPLGKRLVAEGLSGAGMTPTDVNEFYVVSCTGVSIPGLDLHIAGELDMRHDLRRTCIIGMGCYGSFPALRRAHDAIQTRPHERALVMSLELCSLHMQHDPTAENIVSTALFSDGAGMVVLGDEAAEGLPSIVGFKVHSDYQTFDKMAFDLGDHGFEMMLSGYVPDVLAAHAQGFVDGFLSEHNLTRADIRHWGIHPGSTKIVDYIQRELELTDEQVSVSHDVLAAYGNMSSATILFVLERICDTRSPAPGDYGVLIAFGPGLTIETMLVQW